MATTYRKVLFAILLVAQMVVIYLLFWYTAIGLFQMIDMYGGQRPFEFFGEFLVRTLRFLSPSVLLLAWEYQYTRKQHLQRIRTIEREKLNTEIKYLKAQINPHFLFNTLNNLYSFVLTESPKALDMVTRLSGILDYVLTKSQERKVPLAAEVSTIEHYVALEKVRYGDRLQVTYESTGIKDQKISPLIILSIIENAFKHGASGDIDHPEIKIHISADDSDVHCAVWNTKSKYVGEINDDYKKGIGLSNIKRQLDLIYPASHTLEIEDTTSSFEVSLSINTAA